MGCGASTLLASNRDGHRSSAMAAEPATARRSSLLARRLEEIKLFRKNHKRWGSTVSEKQLLEDDREESERVSSSNINVLGVLPGDFGGGGGGDGLKASPRVGIEGEVRTKDSKKVGVAVRKSVVVSKVEEEEEKFVIEGEVKEGEKGEEEEEDDDDGDRRLRVRCRDEDLLLPGSPSFREYCIDLVLSRAGSDADAQLHKDGQEGEENVDHSQRKEVNETSVVVVKNEHKGKRFKIVLPKTGQVAKSGQVAVKTILNVTSCYSLQRSTTVRNEKNCEIPSPKVQPTLSSS